MDACAPHTHLTVPVTTGIAAPARDGGFPRPVERVEVDFSMAPYISSDTRDMRMRVRIGNGLRHVVEALRVPDDAGGRLETIAVYPLHALEAAVVIRDAPNVVTLFATAGASDVKATVRLADGREVGFQDECLHLQFGGSSLLLAPVEGAVGATALMDALLRATQRLAERGTAVVL